MSVFKIKINDVNDALVYVGIYIISINNNGKEVGIKHVNKAHSSDLTHNATHCGTY